MSGQKIGHKVQILEKFCVCSRGHIFCPVLLEFGQNICLMISWTSLKMGHMGSKTRLASQILETPCIRYRSHIFSPVLLKDGHNVFLDLK